MAAAIFNVSPHQPRNDQTCLHADKTCSLNIIKIIMQIKVDQQMHQAVLLRSGAQSNCRSISHWFLLCRMQTVHFLIFTDKIFYTFF